MSYQEDAEALEHRRELVHIEDERRRGTGMVDLKRDDWVGITQEGQSLGHRYVMGNVNAYCPQCSKEQGVTVLDCDYDLDK